jgi:hypothetical protein
MALLPSEELEHRILGYLLNMQGDPWHPISIAGLANVVSYQDQQALMDTLRRLWSGKKLDIRKWEDLEGFRPFSGDSVDQEFFGRGNFELRITAEGRPYFEVLDERKRRSAVPPEEQAILLNRALQGSVFRLAGLNRSLEEVALRNLRVHADFSQAFAEVKVPRELIQSLGANLKLAREAADFTQAFADVKVPRELIQSLGPNLKLAREAAVALIQWQASLESVTRTYSRTATQIAAAIHESTQKWYESFAATEMLATIKHFCDMSDAISRIAVALPQAALQGWSPAILSERLGLVESALKNAEAYQTLRHASVAKLVPNYSPSIEIQKLAVAGLFVYDHDRFIRSLPPAIPSENQFSGEEKEICHRGEQVCSKLEAQLFELDRRLFQLWRRSWESIGKGDPASARLAAHGMRELYDEVLRKLAPDEEMERTDIWLNRIDRSLKRPTRRMRITYIVGDAIEQVDGVVEFGESLSEAQKFAHTFPENPEVVRVYMSELANCIYLLIVYAGSRG